MQGLGNHFLYLEPVAPPMGACVETPTPSGGRVTHSLGGGQSYIHFKARSRNVISMNDQTVPSVMDILSAHYKLELEGPGGQC